MWGEGTEGMCVDGVSHTVWEHGAWSGPGGGGQSSLGCTLKCTFPQAQPHLVLGQQLASPVGMGDVMKGESQVVITVLEQQGLGLLHQIATQSPLQLQHLLWVE